MKRQNQDSNKPVKPSFGQSSEQQLPSLDIKRKISLQGQPNFKKTYSIGSAGSNKFGKNKLPQVIADSIRKKAHQSYVFRDSKSIKQSRNMKNTGQSNYGISSLFKTQKKVYDQPNTIEMNQMKIQQDRIDQSKIQMDNAKKTRMQNRKMGKSKLKKGIDVRVQDKIKKHYDRNNQSKTEVCNICALQLPQQQFQGVSSKCNHYYCASCLQQYIIYKINTFEDPQCPDQSCRNILQTTTQAYSQLPLDLRNKFKKIRQYEISKQSDKRLCPKEDCDGILDLSEEQNINPFCNLCKKTFCRKCFFQVHQGACDPYQLNFFQDTLHYRQCNKCKKVIQKISGCNHMTCTCGYQFCYICSKKWRSGHLCNNPQNEPINVQRCQCCCCDCQCCDCWNQCVNNDDCCQCCCERCCQPLYQMGCCRCCQWCCQGNCCDNFCQCLGECCDNICNCGWACCPDNCCQSKGCKIIKAVPLFLLWLLLIVPMLLIGIALFLCFWFCITLIVGLFGYPFVIICDHLEGCMSILAVVFFPITMIAGVGLAFKQIFCQTLTQQVPGMCEIICTTIHDICQGIC